MGLHCSIRELQCIQYFKSVFLEILNVHIRSVFVNPVTYIYDIRFGVSSNLRLLADDCILYRVIECDHDHNSLQSDLDLIVKWT